MAIAFIDAEPIIEPRHGNFVLTFDSGGEQIQLMLTRHALFKLGRRALAGGQEAFASDAEVVPFDRAGRV